MVTASERKGGLVWHRGAGQMAMNNVCRLMCPHTCASCGHKHALPYKLGEFCLADSCCIHLWALPDTLQQSVQSWQSSWKLRKNSEFCILVDRWLSGPAQPLPHW